MKFIKAIVVVVILILIIKACNSSSKTNSTSSQTDINTPVAVEDHDSKIWQYTDEEDKMTSKKTYYAQVDAKELLNFGFPYNGGSTATLTIRNKEGENNIYLSVTKGQMLTNSYEETSYRVRFDDKPPQYYPFVGPSDNSTTLVFINNANKFIRNLKQAKKVIIELEFYQEGLRPIEFNIEGLKWGR